MFDKDRWQEIFYALGKNRMRTFLTALGVIWGIFLLIVLVGISKGLENGLYYGFEDFALKSVFLWTERTTKPYKGFDRGRYWNFDDDDTKAILDKIKEVKNISPRAGRRSDVVYGQVSQNYRINGDFPSYNDIDPIKLVKGRFINQNDIRNRTKVAVIGIKVKEELFKHGEDPIDKYIKIQGVYFKVVGVHKSPRPPNRGGDWQNSWVNIPFTTMQKTYNMGNRVDYYAIAAHDWSSAYVVEDKVKELLAERHSIAPDDVMAFGSENVEKQVKQFFDLLMGVNILTWFVGTMTLIAGVIGISNIMLVVIKERTKEIGIQRALGATPGRIIGSIIQETIFLTFLAGFTGLFIATIVVEVVGKLFLSDTVNVGLLHRPEINLVIAIIAIVIMIIAGTLAGLIPARRAIKIKPIDALRSEL
ncbi:MAG: ABC transporter permease [Bacteroidales bacterium]|nr:ABC transporter permease [Bacteroidales bacterium]